MLQNTLLAILINCKAVCRNLFEKERERNPPVREVAGYLCYFANSIWIESGNGTNIQLAVALLLDVRYHSLESGAASDCGKCLGGDAVSNALKALLHESFTLWQEENKGVKGAKNPKKNEMGVVYTDAPSLIHPYRPNICSEEMGNVR